MDSAFSRGGASGDHDALDFAAGENADDASDDANDHVDASSRSDVSDARPGAFRADAIDADHTPSLPDRCRDPRRAAVDAFGRRTSGRPRATAPNDDCGGEAEDGPPRIDRAGVDVGAAAIGTNGPRLRPPVAAASAAATAGARARIGSGTGTSAASRATGGGGGDTSRIFAGVPDRFVRTFVAPFDRAVRR